MRHVLMIAYHFPPLAGSSGIQRTLRFVQHLPSFGWKPIVLSIVPRAYEKTSHDLLPEIPADLTVRRSFALDAARHLAIAGRYPGWAARPDRWISWKFSAVADGLRLIEQYRPAAIWSTYPIATAHVIGEKLQRKTGLPWIADFRDPMAQEGYPPDPLTWQSYQRIEASALRQARYSVFTTPSAARTYRERYPDAGNRVVVVENGYDEESFAALVDGCGGRQALEPGCLTLLHSGIVYPSERDPRDLLIALRRLADAGVLRRGQMKIRFRAAVHDGLIRALAAEHGVDDFIELLPAVPYREALSEMVRADGLLVMQAANCNEQVPAKIYEYLRAGRPILALTDPSGDTANVLRRAGVTPIARLDAAEEIAALLPMFLESIRNGREEHPDPAAVAGASRRRRSEALAGLLDRVVSH